jgi:hypothetical protein
METGVRAKMDFADQVDRHHQSRAEMVHRVRSDRENMQRDQENTKFDREMQQKQLQAPQGQGGGAPAEQPEQQQQAPQQQPQDEGAMIAQLGALLAQRNQPKKYNFIRDPKTGRITGAEEIPVQEPA